MRQETDEGLPQLVDVIESSLIADDDNAKRGLNALTSSMNQLMAMNTESHTIRFSSSDKTCLNLLARLLPT